MSPRCRKCRLRLYVAEVMLDRLDAHAEGEEKNPIYPFHLEWAVYALLGFCNHCAPGVFLAPLAAKLALGGRPCA